MSVVSLEDLLYNVPEDQRPKVRLTRPSPATGLLETVLEPLRPEHVYIVKSDVEGVDGLVVHRQVASGLCWKGAPRECVVVVGCRVWGASGGVGWGVCVWCAAAGAEEVSFVNVGCVECMVWLRVVPPLHYSYPWVHGGVQRWEWAGVARVLISGGLCD